MNFKDYLPAFAMMIPTLLLIVAAILALVLPDEASPANSAAEGATGFHQVIPFNL